MELVNYLGPSMTLVTWLSQQHFLAQRYHPAYNEEVSRTFVLGAGGATSVSQLLATVASDVGQEENKCDVSVLTDQHHTCSTCTEQFISRHIMQRAETTSV